MLELTCGKSEVERAGVGEATGDGERLEVCETGDGLSNGDSEVLCGSGEL